jgi:hypothetical protein
VCYYHARERVTDTCGVRSRKRGSLCFLIVLIRIWQDLDTAQQKTRLAVTLALEEISIIESCVAAWDELDAVLDPGPNRYC